MNDKTSKDMVSQAHDDKIQEPLSVSYQTIQKPEIGQIERIIAEPYQGKIKPAEYEHKRYGYAVINNEDGTFSFKNISDIECKK